MNKALLISLYAKWWREIESLRKTLEFRGENFRKVVEYILEQRKLGKDVKFYIYESKGKKLSCKECMDKELVIQSDCYECKKLLGGKYEGIGKVVGYITIGEVYDLNEYLTQNLTPLGWYEMGLDLQKHKYAFEIKDLVVYDTPKELNKFVNYNLSEKAIADVPVTKAPQSFMYVREVE